MLRKKEMLNADAIVYNKHKEKSNIKNIMLQNMLKEKENLSMSYENMIKRFQSKARLRRKCKTSNPKPLDSLTSAKR